jgi:hypothetical protein
MPLIESYTDAVRLFDTAKDKQNGKPLLSFGRLHKDGDAYVINIRSTPIARLTPDNVLEYTASVEQYRAYHSTISMSLHNVIPVQSMRVGSNKYRVAHKKWIGWTVQKWGATTNNWERLRNEAQEYFKGAKIDMVSGDYVNPRPDMTQTVVPEKRKTWLRSLRNFKNGLKVRQKLGVFDGLVNDMGLANVNHWEYRFAFNGKYIDMLVRNMKGGTFEDQLMRDFVQYARGQTYGLLDGKQVMDTAMYLLKDLSAPLRREFEVFGDAE